MTKVKFFIGDNRLNGFEIKGHSGFSEEGSDIVCAAVSSAALMTVNTIIGVIEDKADVENNDGFLKLYVSEPSKLTADILEGLRYHLNEISKQYPENIRIIYGGSKNA